MPRLAISSSAWAPASSGTLEVPEHLVPVPDRGRVADLLVQQGGDQVAFLPVPGDSRNDLIEVEVGHHGPVRLVRQRLLSGLAR